VLFRRALRWIATGWPATYDSIEIHYLPMLNIGNQAPRCRLQSSGKIFGQWMSRAGPRTANETFVEADWQVADPGISLIVYFAEFVHQAHDHIHVQRSDHYHLAATGGLGVQMAHRQCVEHFFTPSPGSVVAVVL
jgi:hypothetical protein